MHPAKIFRKTAASAGLLLIVLGARGQSAADLSRLNVVVPQAAVLAPASSAGGQVAITRVTADIDILEQIATTTLNIHLRNAGRSRAEAELLVPVPEGAVVRGFAFAGAASEPTARLLPREEAKRTYENIVARLRDPALVEFAGCNLIRSSVFPVPPGGEQQVRLIYEHVLPRDGQRVDYELPRTESLQYRVPWDVKVTIRSKLPVATVYSPSHGLDVHRTGPGNLRITNAADANVTPGSFRLSYLLGGDKMAASLFAYPADSGDGGYFLLLAGLPVEERARPAVRRELTLVLDVSGSMSGEKLQQARAAAEQVIGGLLKGERFNILVYNDTVQWFAAAPVARSPEMLQAARAFLARTNAGGGTNIHDALTEALRAQPAEGFLPIVLFLTDGCPTVGNTSEVAIRRVATDRNHGERRIFTFGVGADVNTPLLQKIAAETRGTATFVLPGENVESKVAAVFKDLEGPIFCSATLHVEPDAIVSSGGVATLLRASQIMPETLPDLYVGDQLVVLGRYVGHDPLEFTLRGDYHGERRAFRFTFPLMHATTRNAFVPRLWASRRIGYLVDEIRQMGADAGPAVAGAARDPRVKELVDEIVSLSAEFGILTEYTAFFAEEGTNLADRDAVVATANDNLAQRAMAIRSGTGAVSQGFNNVAQQRQVAMNYDNRFLDGQMNRVEITNVQQVNDRAFFQRGRRWIDSRVAQRAAEVQPDEIVIYGSPEYLALAARLAAQNRAGTLALSGEVLLQVDGKVVLVRPAEEATQGGGASGK